MPNLGLRLGLGSVLGRASISYTPEATALFARMTAQPDATWKAAYNAMYLTSGFIALLAKLDAFYVFCGPDQQVALLNLCASNTATNSGGLTHTPRQGFVNGGASKYINSGLTHNALTNLQQNSSCAFVYAFGTTAGVNNYALGLTGSSNRLFISTLDTGNTTVRGGDATSLQNAETTGQGLFLVNRTGASAKALYKGATSVASDASAAGTRANEQVCFFRLNTTYVGSGNGMILSFGGFGAQLSGSEVTLLKSVIDTFLSSVIPLEFMVTPVASQSNIKRQFSSATPAGGGSGDGSAGSDSVTTTLTPTIQAYLNSHFPTKPNNLHITNTADNGSSILNIQGGSHYWWNTAGGGTPGDALTNWDTAVTAVAASMPLNAGLSRFHAIVFWISQGEAEVTFDEATAPMASWKAQTKLVIAYARARVLALGFTGTVYIVRAPLGPNSSVDQTRLAAFRSTEADLVSEDGNAVLAPSTLSIVRVAADDWHAIFGPTGYQQMALDAANTINPLLAA